MILRSPYLSITPACTKPFLTFTKYQANIELNDMIEHYEGLLLSRENKTRAWIDKFSSLEADHRTLSDSLKGKHELEDQIDHLKSELGKTNDELQAQYSRYDSLDRELSSVQDRLCQSEQAADTSHNHHTKLNLKYKALVKLRDSELAKSASRARKEVKGHEI